MSELVKFVIEFVSGLLSPLSICLLLLVGAGIYIWFLLNKIKLLELMIKVAADRETSILSDYARKTSSGQNVSSLQTADPRINTDGYLPQQVTQNIDERTGLLRILQEVAEEITQLYSTCRQALPLPTHSAWAAAKSNQWILLHSNRTRVKSVNDFYSVVSGYQSLARARGSGHKIEQWLDERQFPVRFESALRAVTELQEELNG